jgi:hypothetical protein
MPRSTMYNTKQIKINKRNRQCRVCRTRTDRAHQIVHDSIKKLKVAEFHKPPYLDEAIALMKRLKIEKSSRDCFQTFLAQVPLILSKAFGVSTIRDGWAWYR